MTIVNDTYTIGAAAGLRVLSGRTFETLSASLGARLPFTGPAFGFYLEGENSFSEKFQRILAGTILDIGEDWRLNVSVQDLQRLEYLTYDDVDRYFDGKKMSMGTGIDYFGLHGGSIYRVGLTVLYSDTDTFSFGQVGQGVSETRDLYREWSDYLYFQGSENAQARMSADIRLLDDWKLSPSAGIAFRTYDDLGDQSAGEDAGSETRPA